MLITSITLGLSGLPPNANLIRSLTIALSLYIQHLVVGFGPGIISLGIFGNSFNNVPLKARLETDFKTRYFKN